MLHLWYSIFYTKEKAKTRVYMLSRKKTENEIVSKKIQYFFEMT